MPIFFTDPNGQQKQFFVDIQPGRTNLNPNLEAEIVQDTNGQVVVRFTSKAPIIIEVTPAGELPQRIDLRELHPLSMEYIPNSQ
jgi:hypothetical protein